VATSFDAEGAAVVPLSDESLRAFATPFSADPSRLQELLPQPFHPRPHDLHVRARREYAPDPSPTASIRNMAGSVSTMSTPSAVTPAAESGMHVSPSHLQYFGGENIILYKTVCGC
jgi:hypothetical protein